MHFLVLCECGLQQMVKAVRVATRETKRQLHGNTEEGLTPDFCLFFSSTLAPTSRSKGSSQICFVNCLCPTTAITSLTTCNSSDRHNCGLNWRRRDYFRADWRPFVAEIDLWASSGRESGAGTHMLAIRRIRFSSMCQGNASLLLGRRWWQT